MKRFAVIGNPISHSKSPMIHSAFAKQLGHEITYETIEGQPGHFSELIARLIEEGYSGTNVTLPFKGDAFAIADELSQRAELAKAVNTLTFSQGKITGDNTDGQGLVQDLLRQLPTLKNQHLLLIGAGGAAKGVIKPLFDAGIEQITICNRTIEKAVGIKEQFEKFGVINCCGFEQTYNVSAGIIVNSTSTSVSGELPSVSDHIYKNASFAYDMFYAKSATRFMTHAKELNSDIIVSDGLGMLVGQAAESYRVWSGEQPEMEPVLDSLRQLI